MPRLSNVSSGCERNQAKVIPSYFVKFLTASVTIHQQQNSHYPQPQDILGEGKPAERNESSML